MAQAGDLLTSLGIPLTTDPTDNERSRGRLSAMYTGAPRTLTLTERIVIGCARAQSGIYDVPNDSPVPPDHV